jgi:hypothetical protein
MFASFASAFLVSKKYKDQKSNEFKNSKKNKSFTED